MWHESFCPPRKLAALMVVAAWTALAWPSARSAGFSALASRDSGVAHRAARNMDYLTTVGGLPSVPGASWVQKQPEPLDVHFAAQERDASRMNAPY
mgnify:CR=1 FL=1